MRIFVQVAYADSIFELGPGDIIGRMGRAALAISEPNVSEAHAMLSLRRGRLWLLSLRRMLSVDGAPVSEVELREGLVVELAAGVTLKVVGFNLPAKVWALEAARLGCRVLPQVVSLFGGPPPRMLARFESTAEAHMWWDGSRWLLRGATMQESLTRGDSFEVGPTSFTLTTTEAPSHGLPSTSVQGAIESPLHIIAHYDTVEIHRQGRPVLNIGGVGAHIFGELVAFDGPVNWSVAAREIWSDEVPSSELRHRWDVTLGRLRKKLRGAGIRSDLIRADGTGSLQLVLGRGDTVEDRT